VRHLIPFFLLALLAADLWLARESHFFRLTLAMQAAFYLLAVAGALLRHRRSGSIKLLSVPYYFCLVNAAALLGVLSIVRGSRVREWSPRGT
jgi:hypothetical protein